MIDRSIEQDMVPSRVHFVKGKLLNIIRVSQNEHQLMLVFDMMIQNKGLSEQQETNQIQKYIGHVAEGLSLYFSSPPRPEIKLSIYNLDLTFCEDEYGEAESE